MHRVTLAERAGWRDHARRLGFHFHTIDGSPYWNETAYYAFTLRQVEEGIEAPTQELHQMAMAMVDKVLASEGLLKRLEIPATHWDWLTKSWLDQDPHWYGRMDLAYDGVGPAKLFELNYDTPTSVYEAAYFQWDWLEARIRDGALPAQTDQFNRIQEALCERIGELAMQKRIAPIVHFAAVHGNLEDQSTVQYLRDCANQVGVRTATVDIEEIGVSADGHFVDGYDYVIESLFKLYPLEDLMREAFGQSIIKSNLQLIEPAWKAVLSNKGILALLWEEHRGHPNLLETGIAPRSAAVPRGFVSKPLLSREGANVSIHRQDGTVVANEGPYVEGAVVHQAVHELPQFDGVYPVIGSWVVGDEAVGMGIREDRGLISTDGAQFVPHVIRDAH